jgi:dTDP-4-amino-4,6-dideoxygalactose transaminase
VTTNSDEYAERLRHFRSHGMVAKPDEPGEGGWYYEIEELGYNYRITDVQCALGVSQLAKLSRFVTQRHELAERYHDLLADLPVELPARAPMGWRHGHHLFPVRVAERRRVYDELRAAGVGVQVHYVPIYRHPIYRNLGITPAEFPETERAYAGLLSLPLYPALTDADQHRVVDALRAALRA